MFKKICVLAIATLMFLPAQAAEVGQPAPGFTADDITGHAQSPEAYAGKIIVLEWNNPSCPFVKKHYESGNMQALQKYAVKKGVVWLTVNSGAPGKEGSMDEAAAKAKIKEVGGHETAYILDSDGTIGRLYGATATPHMFVIDQKGVLAYAGAIDDKPGFDKADVKTAHNYVKAAIDALLAGKPVEVASSHVYGCSVKYKD